MTPVVVAGGVYREICLSPSWRFLFGSGGRAAAALGGLSEPVVLHTYMTTADIAEFRNYAETYGIELRPRSRPHEIEFEYVHPMSVPVLRPPLNRIQSCPPLVAEGECVLRFGMLEGSAKVRAERCVYDPQSAFEVQRFSENGSKADQLAIVGNSFEIRALGASGDLPTAAGNLLADGVSIVVAKEGPKGATLFTTAGTSSIPAYYSKRVWTVGSGDVFAAAFAQAWGAQRMEPLEAARFASAAVSRYADTASLPMINEIPEDLRPVAAGGGKVYLAGPFFDLSKIWIVTEARRCLRMVGLDVFSPMHDVGHGAAEIVGPRDAEAIRNSDLIFALLDGLDPGTLVEVGFARALGIPVYALAEAVSEEDLKMVIGTGCTLFSDFVSAVHHAGWRT